ncbi:rRNA maturation RNase YbeY [Zobellia galactanivorans]|uniref:rRNA maturation RNase YbeY n=1 Tax=Zobellia galactanivorans (strain DSM 12802 / CCUG 47099 / CIP 106680 / NCIMB 13871 / Dsij) TaxID=63186 RepID=UPI0026E187DB|nr:rRNA maturation RNase YbeY [Zobellia galactanivorans]MDO6809144.1 rRNA maturation RNase YbeY [Zobellia galactanivorans]
MIDFHFNTDFSLENPEKYSRWLEQLIESEQGSLEQLDYIFCSDEELLDMNQKYLSHDTYTDILTFDYTEDEAIAGDIFISVDRVRDNAQDLNTEFEEELRRVMAHGVLHLFGYKDKTDEEASLMRTKEEEKMAMFHVEQ